MPNHQHAEAFCLMTYRADDGSEEERIWNSRDGVTPFVISLRSGKVAKHVDWNRDEYRPDYVPAPGERMFVDMTEERARELAKRNAEHHFARAAEDPSYPDPRRDGFATVEDLAAVLAADALERPGAPDLIEVQAEAAATPPAEHRGPFGTATQIKLPGDATAAQTVDHWLITAPMFHPMWSQYVLLCVKLEDDVPGFPPPHRQFPGATHEVLVLALNPQHGPYTPQSLLAGGLHYLEPVNICQQFIATDDEMRQLVGLAAYGVVNGVLNPETADAPERVRRAWLTSLTKTLAHVRGEEHAP